MRTEYCAQMRREGQSWEATRKPFEGSMFIVDSKEYAERFNDEAKAAWSKVPEQLAPLDTRPVDYRVVKRKVSDWTEA